MEKEALEILNKYINFSEDGVIERPLVIKAMIEYAKIERDKEKQETKDWLINEDFEGLADRI